MHRIRPSILPLVALLVVAAACDKTGIHDLASPIDTIVPCDPNASSTWIRSTEEGVELFVIGATRAGIDGAAQNACFVRAELAHNTSADIEAGSYTLEVGGQGTFEQRALYTYEHHPEQDLFHRLGSQRMDFNPSLVHDVTITIDGDQIIVGYDGTQRRLTSMYDLIANLDPDSQAGAEDIFRVANLPIFLSGPRIPGFNSSGMSAYFNSPGVFLGLIRNTVEVLITSVIPPHSVITYSLFEDLNGVILDGPQYGNTDIKGDGNLSGTTNWQLRGSDNPDDIALSGAMIWDEVHLVGGAAAPNGSDDDPPSVYIIQIDGHGTYDVSWMLGADVDLTKNGLLPIEAP